jgi:hypothetical protein
VIGEPVRSRGRRLVRRSVPRRVLELAGPVEVCVVPSRACPPATVPAGGRPVAAGTRAALPSRRRVLAWLLAAAGPAALVAGLGVTHLIDGPVVIVLAAVGTAIGGLVHALAHRARRAARTRAKADQLARLVACAVVDASPGNGLDAKPHAPGYTPQDSR